MKTIKITALLVLLTVILCCGQRAGNNRNNQPKGDPTSAENNNQPSETTPPLDSLVDKNYLLGKFEPSAHPLFVKIDPKLTTIPNGYVRKEVHQAFEKMHAAAATEGVELTIVSATRNFNAQKRIWESKWNGTRLSEGINLTTIKDPEERARMILRYSSMPGTSRHHWGTDIDINSVSPAYFKTPAGMKVYNWLSGNAHHYGFCQTYTTKDSLRPTGYEEEPWHWSYTPVSSQLLQQYRKYIRFTDIKGFLGDQTAEPLDVINHYVLGVNPDCK